MKNFFQRVPHPFLACLLLLTFSCVTKKEIQPATILLDTGWYVFSSSESDAGGNEISSDSFEGTNGYQTSVPSTVLAALARNNVYKDIYVGDNFDKIPKKQFEVPWWYRTNFTLDHLLGGEQYNLVFEGINYKANIWLNGRLVASADSVEEPFRMYDFSVTQFLKTGKNVLAIEVFPPKDGDLSIGWVDWNPRPADNNMGIWRPVKLVKTGAVGLKNLFIKPHLDSDNLKEASLTISVDISNKTSAPVKGVVSCKIGDINISQNYTLGPNDKKKIIFNPVDYSELHIKNPRIWWPNNLGKPELYTMEMSTTADGFSSDHQDVRFGIRDVKDYINDQGYRGFMINGKKLVIKGAGWVDDVLLDDPDEKVKEEIEYVKHMNLNTIRMEGFWGKNQKVYDYADENGILVMIGWSCFWEWQAYNKRPEDDYMAIRSPEDISLHTRAYFDQVRWLRNHPSVFLWVYASDKLLRPNLEEDMDSLMAKADGTRPTLSSCGTVTSTVSGPSGVKMNGPYAYVTPNYWYVDDKRGGAFGFNTETGPGMQPPPIESIKRMIPKDHLWPLDSIWDYHTGRNEFASFKNWIKPFDNRYGEAKNVEDFAFKAQMANYEAIRPMFESFEVNKFKSTGVIQWMLNSSQPGMLWQLFDWYLRPSGAFYGTKAACRPLNVVYDYKDKNIYLTNDYNVPQNDLSIEVNVLDIHSKIVFRKSIKTDIGENMAEQILKMPVLKDLTTTYFLDLKLKNDQNKKVLDNFYWLSTKKDVLDFEHSQWFITRNTSYADLTGIESMPKTNIEVSHKFIDSGDKRQINVTLNNPSDKLAFFIELRVFGERSGSPILPIFWDDNYVSLLPGEKRVVTGYFYKRSLKNDQPAFSIKGWNLSGD